MEMLLVLLSVLLYIAPVFAQVIPIAPPAKGQDLGAKINSVLASAQCAPNTSPLVFSAGGCMLDMSLLRGQNITYATGVVVTSPIPILWGGNIVYAGVAPAIDFASLDDTIYSSGSSISCYSGNENPGGKGPGGKPLFYATGNACALVDMQPGNVIQLEKSVSDVTLSNLLMIGGQQTGDFISGTKGGNENLSVLGDTITTYTSPLTNPLNPMRNANLGWAIHLRTGAGGYDFDGLDVEKNTVRGLYGGVWADGTLTNGGAVASFAPAIANNRFYNMTGQYAHLSWTYDPVIWGNATAESALTSGVGWLFDGFSDTIDFEHNHFDGSNCSQLYQTDSVCVPHAGITELKIGDSRWPINGAVVRLNTFHGGTGQPGTVYDPYDAMEFGPLVRQAQVDANDISNNAGCGTKIDAGATVIYQYNIFSAGNGSGQEHC